ncbi:SDR family NAD(P)-dependent oxidoreductase [Novosphingobium sp. FSY-8]|uniref:SDR family NAD(P)-dependent oxidoreductase n=1 Tax=Novosphingobium ovatum TaxID=1908523 RepID=A0ABW9XHY3_9SPHN|nr:SDR family NAD(P)-dependent oxidoreductase [Novosphingobium ovatum]NBC38167.1 SDR family NAD(P)-dependent oxidoreductase [Novosphingobium ovatum]
MQMKVAVITGATRGIGRALAQAWHARGHAVVVSSSEATEAVRVAADLGGVRHGVMGIGCDVTQSDDHIRLWEGAVEFFGRVDVWVNNAGWALTGTDLAHQSEDELRRMVDVNLIGTMLGARAAMAGMRAQGGGAIYNMLGAGADGKVVPRMTAYATTKAAVTYLTHALAAEAEAAGSGVIVGGISPGLVITEGFRREHAKLTEAERAMREPWVNTIADTPKTIGKWAARAIDENTANDRIFTWLTAEKIRRRKAGPARRIL